MYGKVILDMLNTINWHVEIIHVVNIHVDLFLWVYGTHENILT